MQRIPDTPPEIAPLPLNTVRPLWSVMIPAYNCSGFLQDAIRSVLEQDPNVEVMQIEVVDDCSTDADVEEFVRKISKGRVSYFCQQENVGSLRNFETCINRAKGCYVHLLHGDDRVKPGFYKHLTSLFKRYPEIGAAFCAWNTIDEKDNLLKRSDIEARKPIVLDNWLYKLAEHTRVQYVAIAVKREVYEKLGSFYGVVYGEDWEMWARIARFYPTAYTPEILAEYREHHNSISGLAFLTGNNIRDISKVIDTICGYLKKEDRKKFIKLAHKNYIHWAFGVAEESWKKTRNKEMVYYQTKEMLKIYSDLKLIRKLFQLSVKIYINSIKRFLKAII